MNLPPPPPRLRFRMQRLLFAGLLGTAATIAAAHAPPDILLIVADDLGYADLGFNGAVDIPTPHLDTLARGGLRFPQAYVSSPVCGPSRAGLMTGRYGQRFGYEHNYYNYDRERLEGLEPGVPTMADRLRAAGYRTVGIGKWHLGHGSPEQEPWRRGFDMFYGFSGGSHDYLVYDESAPRTSAKCLLERNGVPDPAVRGHLTDVLADEAVRILSAPRNQPLFLYLAFNAPHTPLQPRDRDLRRVAAIADPTRRDYAGLVVGLDDAVGRVLGAVRSSGRGRETLVVFLSDNGGVIDARAHSRNHPLRDQKGSVFEGGIRVPLLLAWPGRFAAGDVFPHPVSSLDLLPTFLAAAGAPVSTAAAFDGVNLLPYLDGERAGPPHERLFWRFDFRARRAAIREGRWKLHLYSEWIGTPLHTWLVDLESDPREVENLALQHPERVRDLRMKLAAWEAQLRPSGWSLPPQLLAPHARPALSAP